MVLLRLSIVAAAALTALTLLAWLASVPPPRAGGDPVACGEERPGDPVCYAGLGRLRATARPTSL